MLNLIFKNLLRRKTRTLLTAAGIAIGVSMIVALGAMGEGLRTGYDSMFGGGGSDLTLMQKGSYDVTLSSIEEEVVAEVAALPGVRATTGMLVGNVTAPGSAYFFVFGYDPRGFALQRFQIIEGQGLSSGVQRATGTRSIIMGQQAAEAMKLQIGDVVRLTGGSFKVIGVYSSGSGFEDAAAIISLADAQQLLLKQRQVGAIQVKLDDPRQIDRIRAQLEKLYPRLTITASSQTGEKQQLVGYIQAFAVGIALLAIVIGGIGMTNTVMMSTFERTREIGTLRALGWNRSRVLWLVLNESVVLSAIGGAIGCALGTGLIALVQANSALGFLQGKLTPLLLIEGMLTAIILGTFGGLFPAWRASRLLPIEALRYQGGAGKDAPARLNWLKWETLRSLWRRRGRTLLTLVGISIALMSIVLLAGIADGFIVGFNQLMSAGDTDLIARQADTADLAYSAISDQVGRQITTLPEVQSVSGIVITALSTEEVPVLLVWGYAPYERAIQHFKIVAGRNLNGDHELIVGRPLADMLKTQVGDVVRFGEVGIRLVGIFETGIGYEESSAVVSLREAQALLGKPRQVTMYAIKLHDSQQSQNVLTQIEALTSDLEVSLSSEFANNMPDMERVNVMVVAISALAIIVGGIGMMNTMVMSVYERTREIGTLRALGWRRRRVMQLILKESVALALLGAAFGFIQAAIYGALLQQIPLWGNYLIVTYSPDLILRTLGIALLLGTLGGVYPAWRASNLNPIEALRYE